LAEACLKVDWNSLPVERDPSKTEYKSYGYGYGWDDYDLGWSYDKSYGSQAKSYNSTLSNTTFLKKDESRTEKVWFHDLKYNYVSNLEIDTLTKQVISADLCSERINYEHKIINDLLIALELQFEYCVWDGFKLKVFYPFDHTTECNRNDLISYLPELDYREVDEIGGVQDEYSGYCEDLYE